MFIIGYGLLIRFESTKSIYHFLAMSGTQGPSSSTAQSAVQEYVVRVPKPDKKRYHVMRFNASLKVNVEDWNQVRIERENNLKDFKTEDDMPKFGAGSEFGRDMREEARKKKYGIISKKYNPDDQPWLLRVGGKSGKRYRGIREGGIAENASYYVFTQANDGAFEAFPISEWYDFTPIQTYKTLNAEEAEEEFGRRDKVFNYFTIMLKKRLKNEEEGEGEGEEKNKKEKKKAKGAGDFKISDMDDWINSSDEDDDEDEGGSEKDDKQRTEKEKEKGKKKQPSKKKPNKKKKKDESDDEAWEDSDDGDEEGREVDYITDESSNNSDNEVDVKGKTEMKGVEDEEAIRKMEDSESEEENPEVKKETPETKEETPVKEKAPKDKKEKKEGISSSSSSDTSDSDDFDNDTSFQSAMFMQDRIKSKKAQRKIKKENAQNAQTKSGSNSRSNTPTKAVEKNAMGGLKRPVPDSEKEGTSAKRAKLDGPGMSGSYSAHSMDGISEDSIRRYLMRKPMTTTELLQKFKSKKTGLGRDQMVNTITQILKRLNPEKQVIKGKMYLSIKQSH